MAQTATAPGKAIELEFTPLLAHQASGLKADLVQETKLGRAERPYATGDFYISISATSAVGVEDLQKYMAAALEETARYDLKKGKVVHFRINADHLLTESGELEATAKKLLRTSDKSGLVMTAAPAPALTSSSLPKRGSSPVSYASDPTNGDGHPWWEPGRGAVFA